MPGIWAAFPREMMATNGYIVGVTGGIGSGKTTVSNFFSTLGAALIDTDAVAHALTAVGGGAIGAIQSDLGPQFITAEGSLDRVITRNRVFADTGVKRQLESILHPLIHDQVAIALNSDRVRDAPYAMLVVPLLFETLGYRDQVVETLLVDCPVSKQFERVNGRPGLTESMTARIVDAQLLRAARLQLADDVIWNGGGTEALWPQVRRLHARYVKNAGATVNKAQEPNICKLALYPSQFARHQTTSQ